MKKSIILWYFQSLNLYTLFPVFFSKKPINKGFLEQFVPKSQVSSGTPWIQGAFNKKSIKNRGSDVSSVSVRESLVFKAKTTKNGRNMNICSMFLWKLRLFKSILPLKH